MQGWEERFDKVFKALYPYGQLNFYKLIDYIATLEHAVAKLQQRVQDLEDK